MELLPLTYPSTASARLNFGREVKGLDVTNLSADDFKLVEKALYEHDILLFRNVTLTPEQQYALIKAFDPTSHEYAHGDYTKTKSLLSTYLNQVPRLPAVQVIGHGKVLDHEGITELNLKHAHHANFHQTRVPIQDEALGVRRFYRWHMDAAFYEKAPPKVTALYAIKVPQGPAQTVRYDDGTGDELQVSLGTTAFVSGKIMFDSLPKELKNVAVRAKAKYAPHPFEWMKTARANSVGLGLETEGKEMPLDQLSAWDETKLKIYPFCWKNPVTGQLHLEVHPCGIMEIIIDPLPEGAPKEGVLYPNGVHLTDLRTVRELLYKMQRPGIAPGLVYPHPWEEKDLILFNNRGLLHTVVGVFKEDQIRLFHQCNTAATEDPVGPSDDDVTKWTR